MSKKKDHGIVLRYGRENKIYDDLPLILIMGREPNAKNPCGSELRSYNWENTRGSFWTRAHHFISRICEDNPSGKNWLRSLVRSSGVSPLVFSYLNPVSIEQSEDNKREVRESVNEERLYKHFDNLFDKQKIIGNVKLIIISGGKKGLKQNVELVEDKADKHGIDRKKTKFFWYPSGKDIFTDLQEKESKIKNIIAEYLQALGNTWLGRI